MMYSVSFKILLAVTLASSALAHSWVRCVDYNVSNPTQTPPLGLDDPDPARRIYDESLCSGYPPSFPNFGQPFGQDTGYDFRPSAQLTPFCSSRPNTYTDDRPQAVYSPGETVCLAYPAKNHAAAICNQPGQNGFNNRFIADGGLTIFRSEVNPNTQSFGNIDSFPVEIPNLNGVHQNGVVDYRGYQNCPDFCGPTGTDRATCTVCFTLEDDLTPGLYNFAWLWEFNRNEFYTTCWTAGVRPN